MSLNWFRATLVSVLISAVAVIRQTRLFVLATVFGGRELGDGGGGEKGEKGVAGIE